MNVVDYEVRGENLVVKLGKELDHHNALKAEEDVDKAVMSGNVKNVGQLLIHHI
ncbi:MAG: hypothetical protein GX225_05230 [Clostridiales bacterium]|nr:hypothetical protein [Clostridiales bacterium]